MKDLQKPTVILGGGFVGLFCALHLSHKKYPHPVILINQTDCFEFKPLLYEFLTGEMASNQVFPRYEELLQGSGVTFVEDTVTKLDLEAKQVQLASGLNYDYQHLVLGLGSIQGYFGTLGAAENAFAFRHQEDVIKLSKHLKQCLQNASREKNQDKRNSLLTFTIVGAGPSGVEMAATLADLLPLWYEELGGNIQEIKIVLVNRSPEILKGDVNSELKEIALNAFQNRTVSVNLLLGVAVSGITSEYLEYKYKGQEQIEQLATKTVIWTAGTATNPVIQSLAIPPENKDKHGLPIVTPTLQLLDFPEVFAAGDCAVLAGDRLPPLAQIAYQQAAGIARNLEAIAKGKQPAEIKVGLRGTLMKLGLKYGVANLFNKYQITGEIGDVIRNTVYLEMLPTPIHNFKVTTEYLLDEIFHRYHKPESIREYDLDEKKYDWIANWLGGTIMAIILIAGLGFAYVVSQHPQESPASERSKNIEKTK